MKKLALVTVTYNAEKNLSFFLPSLIKNRDSIDAVYFVDNCSSDTTLETLTLFKNEGTLVVPLEIIANTKNYGYTYAINKGIQKALDDGFDYICVTNNDIIFDEGFMSTFLEDAKREKTDALGVPASINSKDVGLGYRLDTVRYLPKKDGSIKREDLAAKSIQNQTLSIDFPHGGTILFSRFFFEEVGMYDHHLFFGGDELDFLYRVTAYNAVHDVSIKCAVSLRAFFLMDNLSKHNTSHKITKAKRMLQGNARVNLKHRFTPLQLGLYKEQQALIRDLSKDSPLRYIALYLFAFRGLCIEILKYYISPVTKKI